MGFDKGSQEAQWGFCEATTHLESRGQNCKQLDLISYIRSLSHGQTHSLFTLYKCINYAVFLGSYN